MSSEVGTWQGYQGVRHNVAVKRPVALPMFVNSAGLLSVRFPVLIPGDRAIGRGRDGSARQVEDHAPSSHTALPHLHRRN